MAQTGKGRGTISGLSHRIGPFKGFDVGAGRKARRVWNGRVCRALALPRLHIPCRCAGALKCEKPSRTRLPVRRLENRSPRHLHRMVTGDPGKKPAVCDRQLQVPDHALGPYPEPGFAHPLPSAASGAAGLVRPLQGDASPDRNLRRNPPLHRGAYKASGWVHVGTTRGRGKYNTKNECAKPKKDIWLCPLRKNWKRKLTQ